MHPDSLRAIACIRDRACAVRREDALAIRRLLGGMAAPDDLAFVLLRDSRVTLSFHPDRLTPGGRLVMEGMRLDGEYRNQYMTGHTNGGRTAYPGGDRDLWEQRLFAGAYHRKGSEALHRPVYGGLNILRYLDGASPRFGACHFVLRPHVLRRCTFAYGDSHANPTALGTRDAFLPIVRAMLAEIARTGRLFADMPCTPSAFAAQTLAGRLPVRYVPGRDAKGYIEVHIRGGVRFEEDIEGLHVDASLYDSEIFGSVRGFAGTYGIPLVQLPRRRVLPGAIEEGFRGEAVKRLAQAVAAAYGGPDGMLDARAIGAASRASVLHPSAWAAYGGPDVLFQRMKQLWHIAAHFGVVPADCGEA